MNKMAPNQNTSLKQKAPFEKTQAKRALLTLTLASDKFIKTQNDHTEIWAASRDWFLEPWGRDTFIALPGLLLVTGRFEEARQVFSHFAAHEKDGLIPNRIQGEQIEYNTVDASLWFIAALEKYYQYTQDKAFVKQLWPTVRNILKAYESGTYFTRAGQTHHIGLDADGLVISPAQSTWMDADPSGEGHTPVTPRNGKAVEINALWYGAMCFATDFETPKKKAYWQQKAADFKLVFNRKFWNKPEKCLLDVVDGDLHGGAIRPNQIFAISHGKNLLSKVRQRQVLEAVQKDLLTPGGLRTLSPRDSHYQSYYDTSAPMSVKDYAYHQGTIWPWLMGAYIDALVQVRTGKGKYDQAIRDEALDALAPLLQFTLESEYRSLPEVFSGDKPHEPGGTTSQAWSVSEILRVLVEYQLA